MMVVKMEMWQDELEALAADVIDMSDSWRQYEAALATEAAAANAHDNVAEERPDLPGQSTRRRPAPRIFLERTYLQAVPEYHVRRRYRLTRAAIEEVYGKIRTLIDPQTARSHAISGRNALLCTLLILGRGSFQGSSGMMTGISQSTVCRAFFKCVTAICGLCGEYINFPADEECVRLKENFYAVDGFPNVVGVVDGTHIAFRPRKTDAAVYANRKKFYSLNVQLVCDSNMMIRDVNARFPGSCHDSYVLRRSGLYRMLESEPRPVGYLLGECLRRNV